jgi:PhnB protein
VETKVTPYLAVRGAAEALAFYQKAFGAQVADQMTDDEGRIGHAEIRIGDGRIYLADEHPEIGFISPASLGGSAVMIEMTVPDVDSVMQRAVDAGATVARPAADQDYGWRNGKLLDPFGHTWMISTPI